MHGCINLETLPNGINLQALDKLYLSRCSRLKNFPDISTNISLLLLDETGIETFPPNLRLENLLVLAICVIKSEKLWGRVQPLTPLMTTLPHSLKDLFLSNIPSLVELPAYIQNFTKLRRLGIRNCINLEILPTGINFLFLDFLELCGCSRLRTFPDISTNINELILYQTGIEEVPWWIEKFSNLDRFYMSGCNKLRCVSLHISKLKHLHSVDFSDCKALTEASWNDSLSVDATETDNIYSKLPVLDEASCSFPNNFINCFDFDVDQEPIRFPLHSKFMMLSGEEVPSYFTHRTTDISLTNIPLFQTSPSPSFFRFKVCAVVDPKSSLPGYFTFVIRISCRFKGRLDQNHSDFPNYGVDSVKFIKDEKVIHLVIFHCYYPLNEGNACFAELKYDYMDVQIHLSNLYDSTSEIKEWGLRLSDDFSLPEIRLDNEDTLPDVFETDEDNMVFETEHSEESGDINVEKERSKKRIKTTQEDYKMSL